MWRRIKNLWKLSEIEVKDNALTIGEVKIPVKKREMAQIIKRTNDVDEFLK